MDNPEPVVDAKTRMPKGYGFLKKGNPYRTRLCRRMTHAEGKTLFVVTKNRVPIGLRAPKDILDKVFKEDRATRDKRRAVVEKRDEATQDEFKSAILKQFPRIPLETLGTILKHTLKKRTGRVGRTGTLTLEAKARLAVAAHVRHCHTDYDKVIKRKCISRNQARGEVHKELVRVLREWRPEEQQKKTPHKKPKKKPPTKPQPTSVKVTKSKAKAPVTKKKGAKTTNATNRRHVEQEGSGPRTRSTRAAHSPSAQVEMLDDFFNDEDHPIIIDSTSGDSDEEELRDRGDIDEVDLEELDELANVFIVYDTDGDSDEEFEMD